MSSTTRTTRSKSKRAANEHARMLAAAAPPKRHCKHHAAAVAASTSIAGLALGLVLAQGYLYRHQFASVGKVSKEWRTVCKTSAKVLPAFAKLEIKIANEQNTADPWMENPKLFLSPAFLRQIYEKVKALKVAVKVSKNAKAKFEATFPLFEDFVEAQVMVFSQKPSRPHNTIDGMWIGFYTYSNGTRTTWSADLHCRLYSDFTLWSGIRAWRVYDRAPLWP